MSPSHLDSVPKPIGPADGKRADGQYIPSQKELVLGTIIARHAEGYRVDIGSSQMAQLDALAFEGATKRSKPNLKVSLVFLFIYTNLFSPFPAWTSLVFEIVNIESLQSGTDDRSEH